jgi:hypothetical protein
VSGLPQPAERWVRALYAQLGGIQSESRLAPRGWDHPLDGFIVEPDEEQHFTRYRALTLTPDWTTAVGRGLVDLSLFTARSIVHPGPDTLVDARRRARSGIGLRDDAMKVVAVPVAGCQYRASSDSTPVVR